MSNRSLDEALAFQCAPALVGVKPANLMSCDMRAYPELEQAVKQLNEKLNCRALYFRILCRCEGRILLLVYREPVLRKHLCRQEVRDFLKQRAYPEGFEETLSCFAERLSGQDTFPHEAGVILGYPVEDVEGFLKHAGKNCKLCGFWKVYGDPGKAAILFRRFAQCREKVCLMVKNGKSIEEIFHAA